MDELFAEIDRYYAAGKTGRARRAAAAEAARWLSENEDASAMTPERLAQLEQEANDAAGGGDDLLKLDEQQSPVAGRRFTRA